MGAIAAPAGSSDASTVEGLLWEQGLATPVGRLCRGAAGVSPNTPLAQALAALQASRLGAIPVLDANGAAIGILTHKDIVERVTLPQLPLDCPVAQVMSSPVWTLRATDTLQQAALLMALHGIEHVPVTESGRVVGLLSGKDVRLTDRYSPGRVSGAIAAAGSIEELATAAQGIRTLAGDLLKHEVGARELSALITHLNDQVTQRVLQIIAREQDLDLGRACWLAFGSQGRSEQTIATDQDNGLVFESPETSRDRSRWQELGRRVNEGLSACGYALCKGQVMAGNPSCCRTVAEWCGRFDDWIERGSPEDLLNASIYFDLRPVAGQLQLAQPLQDLVRQQPRRVPRFLKQMADNALRNPAPLSWLGTVETRRIAGRPMLDLKHHGTVLFVDAARLFALANGIGHTGTRARFEAIAQELKVPARESEAWTRGFEYLQLLRLQAHAARDLDAAENPNLVAVDSLNDIDRSMLKETLRVARRLQQRMQLDYQR